MWREAEILDLVEEAMVRRGLPYSLLRQVEVGRRRIDGILLSAGGRVGVEVKTSRADFRNESDAKRSPTEEVCDRCVYVAPAGVLHAAEIPARWGLWEVARPDVLTVVRDAREDHPRVQSVDALANSLLARAADHEARARQPETPDFLRAEVSRLSSLAAGRAAAVDRERARAREAAEQVAALAGEQECAECGEPVRYTVLSVWAHVERGAEARCAPLRAERARREKSRAVGAEYVAVRADRVLPALLSTEG